ncbi:chalcone isomerase family protein [Leucothrix arctica]|uniref:Chalcone isomerase n=1 Tax=Leucothrix arctica TaxID=1481894 RepID=A0A317CBC1_9GAMM|nr:chalcone isomerase family protein [Leucothrix arctica]PWQ95858.1 chalcone isomerase [Leucothrix arctica]
MKAIYSMVFGMVLALLTTQASAATLAGVPVPDILQYGGKTMVHNGSGLRKKFFIKLYVGSLYLPKKSKDDDAIIAADEPMAIRLVVTSGRITVAKMKQAIIDGLHTSTKGNLAPIQPQIDQILTVFDKGIAVNDAFDIINVVGSGLHIRKNGEKVLTIRSPAFKKALFGMWLSKTPVDARLRTGLLGL